MSTTTMKRATKRTSVNVRRITVTGMLSAIAFILMFLEFSVPVMPSFIKMDLSDLPALIGAFAFGPVSGVIICLIKNLLHLFVTSSGGIGELSNFILGACFVVPAGIIYQKWKGRKSALIGSLVGAAAMALVSVISNYFIVYPVYYNMMPQETILASYQKIYSGVDSILECMIMFNMPFTFVKGLFGVIITFLIYKHISPILKGAQG